MTDLFTVIFKFKIEVIMTLRIGDCVTIFHKICYHQEVEVIEKEHK